MLNISPTSLKAYLECPRRWYLESVLRVPKEVPKYVMGGRTLDAAVQRYLQGPATGADGPDNDEQTANELAALRAELPHPGTVLVQYRPPPVPVPGLEGQAQIATGGLDFCTPPNASLMVIGDLKRIWHKDAAMTPEQLADDVQSQMYAWLIWQEHAPLEIIWRWTYCVRETRNAQGVVTRKPKAFSVDVKADRARVDAWFERIVLPAARGMLALSGPVETIEHDPDSCEEGNRCFVRASCPLHTGPIKGEVHVDLSRFKTNAKQAAEKIVDATPVAAFAPDVFAGESMLSRAPRIAINPPPMPSSPPAPSVIVDTDATELDVTALEGSPEALAQLGVEAPATVPAPAPEPPKRARRSRVKAAEAQTAPIGEPPALTLENATTEQLRDELIDRGWRVYLKVRA